MSAALNKTGELLQLLYAHSCLQIRYLEIISKVRIYILMIISLWKLSILTIITMTAEIIMS